MVSSNRLRFEMTGSGSENYDHESRRVRLSDKLFINDVIASLFEGNLRSDAICRIRRFALIVVRNDAS